MSHCKSPRPHAGHCAGCEHSRVSKSGARCLFFAKLIKAEPKEKQSGVIMDNGIVRQFTIHGGKRYTHQPGGKP